MSSDYTFLTDHSYSLRPDDDELSLNKREEKIKNVRDLQIELVGRDFYD